MPEKNKPKNKQKIVQEVQEMSKIEPTDKQFMTNLKSLNNILVAHKDDQELRDYRRMFYSLFFMFCVLFLLWVLGLCYVQDSYYQKIQDAKKIYEDEIKNIEFVIENRLKQEAFQKAIDNLDLDTDTSITKYVDPKISYNNKGYVPTNLVPVKSEFIKDSKWYIQVHKVAKEKFNELAEQFYNETQQEIIVVSGYRSYAYQKWIKDRGCPDHLCAKAGHSEHQGWYAIDIYSASTQAQWLGSNTLRKYFDWLNANAHVYGFHNPYRKWREIDGYDPEPWHWRYVWEDLARYLKQNDLTFAEFYYARQQEVSE